MAENNAKSGKRESVKEKSKQHDKDQQSTKNGYYIVATAAIIAIVTVAVVFFIITGLKGSTQQNFTTFMSKFNGASRVGVYAIGDNGTQLSASITCASALIERMLENSATRRNVSTIDYYAINSTACVYIKGLNGQNGTLETPQLCLAQSANQPSIIINYSKTNMTQTKNNTLYYSGDYEFLTQCAISQEIG